MPSLDSSTLPQAGDSSLDNKYWVLDQPRREACNGYEHVLHPPEMVPDVAYWLNEQLKGGDASRPSAAINGAVEATTLASRLSRGLNSNDRFVRDNMRDGDVLVVSVGGNDIALAPSCATVCNMIGLVCCQPTSMIRSKSSPCLSHFERIFRDGVQNYVERLTAKTRPSRVIVAMIYFPDEKSTGSWADASLCCMGYPCCPSKLQTAIRTMFEISTKNIAISSISTVPLAFYEVLDGKSSSDYVERVEPSVTGGRKLSAQIIEALH